MRILTTLRLAFLDELIVPSVQRVGRNGQVAKVLDTVFVNVLRHRVANLVARDTFLVATLGVAAVAAVAANRGDDPLALLLEATEIRQQWLQIDALLIAAALYAARLVAEIMLPSRLHSLSPKWFVSGEQRVDSPIGGWIYNLLLFVPLSGRTQDDRKEIIAGYLDAVRSSSFDTGEGQTNPDYRNLSRAFQELPKSRTSARERKVCNRSAAHRAVGGVSVSGFLLSLVFLGAAYACCVGLVIVSREV